MLLKIREDGLEIVGRPWLGLECRIIGRRSQRQMQFGGAAAESGGGIEINAEMVASQLRDRMLRHLERIADFRARIFGKLQGRGGFEVAIEFFDCPFPTVALVLHQTLQHGKRGCFGAIGGRLQFNGTGEGRNMIKLCFFGEVSPDFNIGIDSGLETAEEFQNEAIAEYDRSVALLG